MEPFSTGTRPSVEVMDIFRLHGEEYKNHYALSREQRKAMADITRCRTASLGGHVDVCDQDWGFTPSPTTPAVTVIAPNARA